MTKSPAAGVRAPVNAADCEPPDFAQKRPRIGQNRLVPEKFTGTERVLAEGRSQGLISYLQGSVIDPYQDPSRPPKHWHGTAVSAFYGYWERVLTDSKPVFVAKLGVMTPACQSSIGVAY